MPEPEIKIEEKVSVKMTLTDAELKIMVVKIFQELLLEKDVVVDEGDVDVKWDVEASAHFRGVELKSTRARRREFEPEAD